MNKRRLLKLADLLEADAKNKKGLKFDLGTWGRPADEDESAHASVSCGTAACAMGLAVLSGAFKRAGLTNYYEGSDRVCPEFGNSTGFDAASMLFGITDHQSDFLFNYERYPQDKRTGAVAERFVAKRIRDFVAGKVSAA